MTVRLPAAAWTLAVGVLSHVRGRRSGAGAAAGDDSALEELRRSEARNRALLEAIPDLMFRIDARGTYRAFKAEDPRRLAVPPDELVGKTLHDVLPRDVAERIMACAGKALEHGGVESVEYRLELDGEEREFEGRIVVGGEDEFVLIVRDFTERKRQEQELQASRARIVRAGDDARRHLERNLHDGAQQRLVALSLALRLAQVKLRDDPAAAERLLASAREELTFALDELRELARGLHPAILTDRGLAAALEALICRSPVPVALEPPQERLPEPVEAAAYYVVSEALANVAKYAGASAVAVRVARDGGAVIVEVADDGIGGADARAGSGLRGLGDRVAALGGRLVVESPRGGGTRVRAELPAAAP